MILALLLAVVPPAQDYEVPARPATWDELSPDRFDRAMFLPEDCRPGDDLLARMRALLALEFELDGARRNFGDLVRLAHALEPGQRYAWLDRLAQRAPELVATWGVELRELLLDGGLSRPEWDPADDRGDDGILMGAGWEPQGCAWPRPDRTLAPRFEQAAVLYRADLATIKLVENDYRDYTEHVGADFDTIYPVRDDHLEGEDEAGQPFRYLSLYSRSDLPFPFSGYSCDLRILNRVDADGNLRTDIYSPSEDFHYMAGCDQFLPVEDSDGATVAYLAVRDFGFDIDGVPDRAKHRREALRATLGNLKRKAERRASGADGAKTTSGAVDVSPADALSALRVLGRQTP